MTTTKVQPVLFLGHGNPMNAIEDNEFSRAWASIGPSLSPRPRAILCISAHWETFSGGPHVSHQEHPKTIHDFGGFPDELYAVEYPAPGSPWLASRVSELLAPAKSTSDESWGFDHGCWVVIRSMFPKADIPVVQMSLDRELDPRGHFEIGKRLSRLRDEGVLIIGSGNIVHNLSILDWSAFDKFTERSSFDWAQDFDQKVAGWITAGDDESLIRFDVAAGQSAIKAVNSAEHYLPLLYTVALRRPEDKLTFFNTKFVAALLSLVVVASVVVFKVTLLPRDDPQPEIHSSRSSDFCDKNGGFDQWQGFGGVHLAHADWIYNPSVAVPWGPEPSLRPGGDSIMVYRTQSMWSSSIHLQLFKLAEVGPNGDPKIPRSPLRPNVSLAFVGAEDGAIRRCESKSTGFEDSRAIAWNGTLFLVTNSLNPRLCRRGITILQLNLSNVRAVLERRQHLETVFPRSVTHLIPPGGFRGSDPQKSWEKNWMPFVHEGRLLFVRFIEPHQIVSCDIDTGFHGSREAECRVFASTRWPSLKRLLFPELRGSSAVVDRGHDFIAVGHIRRRKFHSFFFYTFSKSPPFAITGSSTLFLVGTRKDIQYISGLALVGDHYLVSYSVRDITCQFVWLRRCEVDSMVTELRRDPFEDSGPGAFLSFLVMVSVLIALISAWAKRRRI